MVLQGKTGLVQLLWGLVRSLLHGSLGSCFPGSPCEVPVALPQPPVPAGAQAGDKSSSPSRAASTKASKELSQKLLPSQARSRVKALSSVPLAEA